MHKSATERFSSSLNLGGKIILLAKVADQADLVRVVTGMALDDVAPPMRPPLWVHCIVAVVVKRVGRIGLVVQRL